MFNDLSEREMRSILIHSDTSETLNVINAQTYSKRSNVLLTDKITINKLAKEILQFNTTQI